MALKITFLRLNGLLLASVSLFVFVYSDSKTLDDQVQGWMTHNCTFPPKSVYEEMDSILDPCFENDVEIEYPLSFLCSSLIVFSNTLCIKRPTLKKYFTEESVQQKSNITNICSFAQKYLIGDIALRKYLDKIITPTDMTSCRRYCEVEESAFAKICKLLIAGVAIYQERFVKAGNHGEKMQSPPPVTKGEKLNETKTQLGSDVKNASLLNTTVKPDIPVASSIENSTPLSTDTAPEISDTKPPTLPLSDVTNKIDPTITDSQPTSSQQKKPSDTYENHPPEKEIKTTVSILPPTDKQTFVPITQDTSTFTTSTIGTSQPEYLDNHSEENINEPEGSDIEIKTSNDKFVQREPDAKSTETDNQDDDFEDTPDKEGEKKKTKDDSHNKTQGDEDDSTQKENADDDSTQKENTDDDSYNKSKNVQGNSDEKDQNTENRLVSEDNQEIDQDRDIVPKSGVIQKMEESDDDSSSSSHFMAYFVTALVLCIAGYVIYHNKQKIIAFFLEGRRNGRRRAALGNTKYSKLTPSVEEVMPSLETAASAKNFIY